MPNSTENDVAALVEQMPSADRPGEPSKFTGPSPEAAGAVSHLYADFIPETIENGDGTPCHAHGFGEDFKDGVQGFFQVYRGVQSMSNFVQRRDLFDLFQDPDLS